MQIESVVIRQVLSRERVREYIKDEHQYISELPTPLLDLFISSSSHFCTPFLDHPSSSIFETPPSKSKFRL